MSHRIAVRGRWYWFNVSLRHGFIEFSERRLVWHIFVVENKPRRVGWELGDPNEARSSQKSEQEALG